MKDSNVIGWFFVYLFALLFAVVIFVVAIEHYLGIYMPEGLRTGVMVMVPLAGAGILAKRKDKNF